jgi:hypothetical protein
MALPKPNELTGMMTASGKDSVTPWWVLALPSGDG